MIYIYSITSNLVFKILSHVITIAGNIEHRYVFFRLRITYYSPVVVAVTIVISFVIVVKMELVLGMKLDELGLAVVVVIVVIVVAVALGRNPG